MSLVPYCLCLQCHSLLTSFKKTPPTINVQRTTVQDVARAFRKKSQDLAITDDERNYNDGKVSRYVVLL